MINQDEILQDPQLKVDILMWRVIKLLIKNKKHTLARFNLTCSQFDILFAIYYFSNTKKEIIQIDLSERTETDPMTTSTVLRNLQRKGLITRRRGDVNTRTVIVELTQSGLVLLERAFEEVRTTGELIYGDINKAHLASQLMRLSNILTKLNF